MRKFFLYAVLGIFISTPFFTCFSQSVGIGTSSPNAGALLHVDTKTSLSKGLLVTGAYNASATVPDLGSGSRLMFYPGKAAFRAGFIDAGNYNWNDVNVGFFSAAMGYNTRASGQFSTAIGSGNYATGYASFAAGEGSFAYDYYSAAIGYHTSADGQAAVALGNSTTASGLSATALGGFTSATGVYSTASGDHSVASNQATVALGYYCNATDNFAVAIGKNTTASGPSSMAIGNETTASGTSATAMGYGTVASGAWSTAIGYKVNTNGQMSALIIGDSDPNAEGITYSGYPDEFVARFWNGYYFLTSGSTNRVGVRLGHNGNAWVSICDKNQKENFQTIDGEEVLQKISGIPFSSWNYKQQDPKIYRHYGIMAQDFYNAFGHDDYGTIGNDTTVNPIDMIGIDMTAIQALEKRTVNLKNENATLKEENRQLKDSIETLRLQFDQQQKVVNEILLLTKQHFNN